MTTPHISTGEQPWFVIHAQSDMYQFTPQVAGISQIYRFQAGANSTETFAIPDGCVDIMFDCSAPTPSANLCGSTISAQDAKLEQGHYYFGVRFTPGTILKSFDVSTRQLISQRLNLFDLAQNKTSLLEQLIENSDFSVQAKLVLEHLMRDTFITPSEKTRAALEVIRQHNGNIQIAEVEQLTGISQRTLQRLFSEEIGLSPKAFSRIIRCQSAISTINQASDIKLIELANDLGFSDQPHFVREFKKLISSTPFEYQKHISASSYASRLRSI